MPPRQTEVLDPGLYQLRHIAPLSVDGGPGIPNPIGLGVVVLGQTLYAKPLPMSQLTHSPDMSDGQYILRLGDAGEFTMTFPNRDASDGLPYRSRFETDGHVEFIEISRENEVEAIGCIVKCTPDRQKVVVAGYDGFWLAKEQYERDCTLVMAPRDVIERYTQFAVPIIADDFPGPALAAVWTPINTGTVSTAANGGYFATVAASSSASLVTGSLSVPVGRWSASVNFVVLAQSGTPFETVAVQVGSALIAVSTAQVEFTVDTADGILPVGLMTPGEHSVQIVCDGRSVAGYFDGNLLGNVTPASGIPITQTLTIDITGPLTVEITLASFRAYQPFLMRGTDKGDYVLPGTYTTYPAGGLHGRYYNDLDLQSDANRLARILQPYRTVTPGQYADQLDAQILGQAPAVGGAATNWSVRWFGSMWLPLGSAPGTYTFQVQLPNASGTGTACRLWVGKTMFTEPIIDQWTFTASNRDPTGTVSSSGLSGTNTDGTLTAKDGWYPLILEYAVDAPAIDSAPSLAIYPPANYTDPGGSPIVTTGTFIPSSSLSALGCIDNRYQGTSYFDIVQQTAIAAGYQFWAKPQSLESGLFPASVAPRIREGRDWDERIEEDDIDTRSGINNVSNVTDATDIASSIQVAGAGLPDGITQLFAEIMDPATQAASLFDIQAWVDANDISFGSLLAARGQAELSQRLTSWQNVTGDPFARNRQADTIPLTGSIQGQLLWLPGDGVFLDLPDVDVVDVVPRQMLQITRNILAQGRASTSIGFRNRPKDALASLRKLLLAATRPQRVFQGQYVERDAAMQNGSVAAGATDSGSSEMALQTSETVVGAALHITVITTGQVGVVINGVDQTTALGGPWGPATPVTLDVSRFAMPTSSGQFYVQLKNLGSIGASYQYQLVAILLKSS